MKAQAGEQFIRWLERGDRIVERNKRLGIVPLSIMEKRKVRRQIRLNILKYPWLGDRRQWKQHRKRKETLVKRKIIALAKLTGWPI